MARTRQEIFDKAYLGLASQGFERSSNDEGACKYRGPRGLKCALGHAISDDDYETIFEGSGPDDTSMGDIIIAAVGASNADVGFLCQLQKAHDNSFCPAAMKAALHDFATKYGLTIPTHSQAA